MSGYYDVFNMRFDGDVVLVTMYTDQRADVAVSVDATAIAYFKIKSGFAGAFARLAEFLFPKKVDERIERFVRAAESIAVASLQDPAAAYSESSRPRERSAPRSSRSSAGRFKKGTLRPLFPMLLDPGKSSECKNEICCSACKLPIRECICCPE